jgi:MFS family permease
VFTASFAFNTAANLYVLFPVFVTRLGGSAGAIGAVVGTGSLAALLARPIVGPAIDAFGRKWVVLRFLLLDALAAMLYLAISSLGWPIYLVRALHGAIDGTARVALFAFVYEILPEGRQGEAMATFSLCGMVPGALAPMAGEELIRRWGFNAFFALVCGLCLSAAAATSRLRDDRPPAPASARKNADGPGYAALLADRALLPLWIATLLFALSLSSRLSFVAPFAYQRGIQRVGWYFAIYSSVAVALRFFSGRSMDRIGLERMLVPSFATLAVGLAMLALTGRWGMLELAALIGGIGHGYVYPVLSALVIGRTQPEAIGRSSSVYGSLYDAGAMAGPYLLGAVANAAGYGPMFLVAGGFAMAAAVYLARVEPGVLGRRLG